MKRLMTPAILMMLAAPAAAQGIEDVFDLTIRTGWRQADGTHIAGIDVRLAPGWKTYWRQPGDVGIPPMFDWGASENLADIQVLYPEPEVTWADGYRSIGYKSRVLFPLEILPRGAGPVQLDGIIQLGICNEVCVPVQVQIKAELPATGASDMSLNMALGDQIKAGDGHVVCRFAPSQDAMELTMQIPKSGHDAPELAVEYVRPDLWIAEPEVTDGGDHWIATTRILAPDGTPTALSRSDVTITSFADAGAVEYKGCHGS